jgi:hypothetical protein
MKFEKTVTPYGWCIFCEDIRREISGKQTFVGVIGSSDLNVLGTLPTGIGKFSVHAVFRQRLADGLDPVQIEIHMPGDDEDKPSAGAELSVEQIAGNLPPPAPDVDDPIMGVAMAFEFNPLQINQEGRIQVSAVKAGKRYRLGSLRVVSRPPPSPESVPAVADLK